MAEEQLILRALRGEVVDRPPFWFMRQAGRFLPEYRAIRARVPGFLELCLSPELAEEVTLQPVRRFHPDAAIVFADILIVPFALGQKVRFVDGEGPNLEAVRSAAELLSLRTCGAERYWAPVLETVARVRAALPASTTLIGFAGAPWTVATYMVEGGSSRDFQQVKGWGYRDRSGFTALIDILTEKTITYMEAQADSGADVLQLFDTWAGVLTPEERRRWVIEPTKRIVASLRSSHPTVPVIGFARGLGGSLADFVSQTGLSAIGLDTSTDPVWARATLGNAVCLQGNLDPQLLVIGGTEMLKATADIVGALGGGRFIFNLGHGILPETPPEHLDELVAALMGWRFA